MVYLREMIYPAQTSFIPLQVALARFLESQGWLGIFKNYPYWYLGTTPFRYLTGPILPSLLVGLHQILSSLNFFTIFLLILAVCWLLGTVGVYLLVLVFKPDNRKMAILAALFFFFGPIVPFLFRFSDGLSLIAFSFLPYVFLLYTKFLINPSRKQAAYCVFLISLEMLISSLIVAPMFLGMAAIFLATQGWKKAEIKIKQTLGLWALAFLLVSIWYTPGYWWRILVAPSFAGKPLFKVVYQLAQLLPISLAVILAIVSERLIKSKDKLLKFTFYWLFIFGFLTFVRFISDPDFWLDWSAYGLEIQFGLAIALALVINQVLNSKYQKYFIFTFYFLLFTFIFNKYVLGTLQKDITQSVEYQIGKELTNVVKPGEKVFLSGTTVFWLNAFFDIFQVRGGNDRVSVNQQWRQAAWELREGERGEKSIEWLKKLKITYIVVHTQESKEFYHDFVYPEKFEQLGGLKKIYEQNGDRIYKLED